MNDPNYHSQVNILPEHIRISLGKYENHQNLTCLECGYSGLMGVKEIKNKTSIKQDIPKIIMLLAVIATILLFIYPVPWWLVLLGTFIYLIITVKTVTILECPNCQNELIKK